MTNLGSQNITSMILNYSVDGAAPVSTLPLTVTFQAGRCYNYTHTTPWTPTSTGWHYIKLWASDLNGNQDEDHERRRSAARQTQSSRQSSARRMRATVDARDRRCVPRDTHDHRA